MPKAFQIEGGVRSSSKVKAALAWVRQGAKIVGLHGIDDNGRCTCRRLNCGSPGKHPIAEEFRHGHHSAIRRKSKIQRVFKKYPSANLGVILPPGLVVIDVDGPEGEETFSELDLPKTLAVRTGRGMHHYYVTSEPLPAKLKKLSGIDIKHSNSGYLIVPPSTHHSGENYRWKRAKNAIAELPKTFLQSLARESSVTVQFDAEKVLKAGNRNNELTKIAGSLRFNGHGTSAISGALQGINAAACKPPLDDDEGQSNCQRW